MAFTLLSIGSGDYLTQGGESAHPLIIEKKCLFLNVCYYPKIKIINLYLCIYFVIFKICLNIGVSVFQHTFDFNDPYFSSVFSNCFVPPPTPK